MSIKRKVTTLLKKIGYSKINDRFGMTVYTKKHNEFFFQGVVLSNANGKLAIDIGLLDLPMFEVFLKVEGMTEYGVFNLTYSKQLMEVELSSLTLDEADSCMDDLEKALGDFDDGFPSLYESYIDASSSVTVPEFFVNPHRKKDNLIAVYYSLLRVLAYENELSLTYVNEFINKYSNESNLNKAVDFKFDLLRKYLS